MFQREIFMLGLKHEGQTHSSENLAEPREHVVNLLLMCPTIEVRKSWYFSSWVFLRTFLGGMTSLGMSVSYPKRQEIG